MLNASSWFLEKLFVQLFDVPFALIDSDVIKISFALFSFAHNVIFTGTFSNCNNVIFSDEFQLHQ